MKISKTPLMNEFGQAVGEAVDNWSDARLPSRQVLTGNFCRLEPLQADRHAAELYQAYAANADVTSWTYLPYGPFESFEQYRDWLISLGDNLDPFFYCIIDVSTDKAVGVASYLRIQPQAGCIEVGHINFSDQLKQTPLATEAMYLMMKNAFELGNRRYEWKCDALNEPSCRAATRLGFSFEGIFRQALMYKGRNRDTAWYSVIDSEWPILEGVFKQWLSADNFTADGQQLSQLSEMMSKAP